MRMRARTCTYTVRASFLAQVGARLRTPVCVRRRRLRLAYRSIRKRIYRARQAQTIVDRRSIGVLRGRALYNAVAP